MYQNLPITTWFSVIIPAWTNARWYEVDSRDILTVAPLIPLTDHCAVLVAPLIPVGIENPAIRYFAGFAVIFLAVLIGVLLLGHALATLVKAVGLGSADTLLGGALGLAKGLVILVGLTLAAGLTSLPRTEFWKQAMLSDNLQAMARVTMPLLPADVVKYVRFE